LFYTKIIDNDKVEKIIGFNYEQINQLIFDKEIEFFYQLILSSLKSEKNIQGIIHSFNIIYLSYRRNN
jgi:hypothetical protein